MKSRGFKEECRQTRDQECRWIQEKYTREKPLSNRQLRGYSQLLVWLVGSKQDAYVVWHSQIRELVETGTRLLDFLRIVNEVLWTACKKRA